jgi:hypothetical protein
MNMKGLKYILIMTVTILLASCNEWIDPISYVEPGPDQSAPVVTIKYPVEGTSIQVPTLLASVNIQIEVTDDIELKSVSVSIDGTEITSYNTFKDYRRLVAEYLYTNVTNGAHTLIVTGTDLQNKTTTATVHFEKKPPYTPLYNGEIFYMPFDGDYVEKISFIEATKVGNPGFTGEAGALKGVNAYKGATDAYLTFPTTGLTSGEFSAEFWYKVNGSPDRSGILNASPPGEDRTKGFRLFREGSAISQQIKLNVGTGSAETWNDGDFIVAPGTEWVHIAFTVSATECIIYINGAVARVAASSGPMDWTDCSVISIGSGAPNYTYWGHLSDLSCYDELRLFNKVLTQAEIQTIMENDKPYVPRYDGEVFYMPFEGSYRDLVSKTDAGTVGTPGFEDSGKIGKAYAGATDAYLTFPTTAINGDAWSVVFWYKVNASPDRSGIINTSLTGEDRTKGFRIFREGSATSQQVKLNVGTGSSEVWNDGGFIDAPATDWTHVAITVSGTSCSIYLNGVLTRPASAMAAPTDWTGCDVMSIGSGAPNFIYWGHSYDLSLYDELRMFNKELSQSEIQAIINDEN